jgi:hypothetical protein
MVVETSLLVVLADWYRVCHAGVTGAMILGKDSKLEGRPVMYFGLLAHGLHILILFAYCCLVDSCRNVISRDLMIRNLRSSFAMILTFNY